MEYRIQPALTGGYAWAVHAWPSGEVVAEAQRSYPSPSLAYVAAMVWVQTLEEEAVAADPGREYDPFVDVA